MTALKIVEVANELGVCVSACGDLRGQLAVEMEKDLRIPAQVFGSFHRKRFGVGMARACSFRKEAVSFSLMDHR